MKNNEIFVGMEYAYSQIYGFPPGAQRPPSTRVRVLSRAKVHRAGAIVGQSKIDGFLIGYKDSDGKEIRETAIGKQLIMPWADYAAITADFAARAEAAREREERWAQRFKAIYNRIEKAGIDTSARMELYAGDKPGLIDPEVLEKLLDRVEGRGLKITS